MKRYTFLIALIAVTVLSACGNGSTTNEKTDSTTTKVDSTVIDSTAIGATTEPSEIKEVK
jgi:ABC-type glycerol-3-phosphate transport system substrate-binding protein